VTLLLTNEEIEPLLPIADCISAIEGSFERLAAREAINRPRTEVYSPSPHEGARHVLKTMEGSLPDLGVTALRLTSDTISWPGAGGEARKRKEPTAGGRWCGLILLFSHATGEPVAIMPDGVIQRLRVGATNAIAARLLAPAGARSYGLVGAGWQAGSQLMALAAVRDLESVRVYSPSPARREAFALEYSRLLGIPVRAVDSAAEAVEGADIVGTATSSMHPVIPPDAVRDGAHVTHVKLPEADPLLLARASLVVVTARPFLPDSYIVGRSNEPVRIVDVRSAVAGGEPPTGHVQEAGPVDLSSAPDLSDLIAGRVPVPPDPGGITVFVNVLGLGTQFAALGQLAVDRARAAGIGREIPTGWFLEDVHP
jgi:alanine dehydrogenase